MCQKCTTALTTLFPFIAIISKTETTNISNSSETVHIHHNHGMSISTFPDSCYNKLHLLPEIV